MTKIILVRHGETQWNKDDIFRGHIDVPLNEKGINQAQATGKALKNMKIDVVYSSPLSRTMVTAENIAKYHNLKVEICEGLKDLNFGVWQGKSKLEVSESYKDLYELWKNSPHLVQFPEGENLNLVRERSLKTLFDLINIHLNQTIVIVSHRVVCKVLLCTILGLDNSHFWNITQNTCAINIFRYENNKFIIDLINDTCHLNN